MGAVTRRRLLGGHLPGAGHGHGDPAVGEADAVLRERSLDRGIGLAPDQELPTGLGRELGLDDERAVVDRVHPLRVEGREKILTQCRMLRKVLADLLENLLDLLDVGVEGYAELQLITTQSWL